LRGCVDRNFVKRDEEDDTMMSHLAWVRG